MIKTCLSKLIRLKRELWSSGLRLTTPLCTPAAPLLRESSAQNSFVSTSLSNSHGLWTPHTWPRKHSIGCIFRLEAEVWEKPSCHLHHLLLKHHSDYFRAASLPGMAVACCLGDWEGHRGLIPLHPGYLLMQKESLLHYEKRPWNPSHGPTGHKTVEQYKFCKLQPTFKSAFFLTIL